MVLVIASRLERLGWSIVLEQQEDVRLTGQFSRCREAFDFFATSPPAVALIDEAILTARDCATLDKYSASTATRFLLVASHPVEQPLAGSRYSFASECLLKGLPAGELLAAIRRQMPSTKRLAGGAGHPGPRNGERSSRC